MGALFVVVAVAAVLVVFRIATFNGRVGSRNKLDNGFNQIDVQLKRRHDLIPNLVASAQGYMNHERHQGAADACWCGNAR